MMNMLNPAEQDIKISITYCTSQTKIFLFYSQKQRITTKLKLRNFILEAGYPLSPGMKPPEKETAETGRGSWRRE